MELDFSEDTRIKTISSRTTEDRHAWLQALADKHDVSMSRVIDRLLQQAYEQGKD